jgi:hypothetical protein
MREEAPDAVQEVVEGESDDSVEIVAVVERTKVEVVETMEELVEVEVQEEELLEIVGASAENDDVEERGNPEVVHEDQVGDDGYAKQEEEEVERAEEDDFLDEPEHRSLADEMADVGEDHHSPSFEKSLSPVACSPSARPSPPPSPRRFEDVAAPQPPADKQEAFVEDDAPEDGPADELPARAEEEAVEPLGRKREISQEEEEEAFMNDEQEDSIPSDEAEREFDPLEKASPLRSPSQPLPPSFVHPPPILARDPSPAHQPSSPARSTSSSLSDIDVSFNADEDDENAQLDSDDAASNACVDDEGELLHASQSFFQNPRDFIVDLNDTFDANTSISFLLDPHQSFLDPPHLPAASSPHPLAPRGRAGHKAGRLSGEALGRFDAVFAAKRGILPAQEGDGSPARATARAGVTSRPISKLNPNFKPMTSTPVNVATSAGAAASSSSVPIPSYPKPTASTSSVNLSTSSSSSSNVFSSQPIASSSTSSIYPTIPASVSLKQDLLTQAARRRFTEQASGVQRPQTKIVSSVVSAAEADGDEEGGADEEVEETFIKITSNDPREAARATAFLKMVCLILPCSVFPSVLGRLTDLISCLFHPSVSRLHRT